MLKKFMYEVGLFEYNIKWSKELLWAVGLAAAGYVLQIVVGPPPLDPDTITDWQTYLITTGWGLSRVVFAVILGKKVASA